MSTGSLRDLNNSMPVAKVRKKHSEGDVLDFMNCSESQWLQQDEVDALPPSLRFNYFDMFCILLSMLTYLLDLATDIYIAYVFYNYGRISYFVLTLVFVIIPAGTMTAFSLRWYVMDMDNQTIPKPSCSKWVIRIIFLLLQLAPVLRYADALAYGLKSRKAATQNDKHRQIKYYTYMINEDADSTLLRLFESFMESAPQVTLQLYILIYNFGDEEENSLGNKKIQVFSVVSSLLSLAWSLSAYNRSLRFSQPDKRNMSYRATFIQFFWHLCTISARVFALAVFAATHTFFIIPVCIVHWVAMLVWLLLQQGNQGCSNQCEETMFNLVVAFIYVFTFFNIKDEPTRYKYLTFYIISFIENTVLLFAWFFSFGPSTPDIIYFRIAGLVGDYTLFFIGILCMVMYYAYFHPSRGFFAKQEDDIVKENSQGNNPQPSISIGGLSAEHSVPPKKQPLTRKGSIDHAPLSSNPQSATSSRKNVTFALDHPTNTEHQAKAVDVSSNNANNPSVLTIPEGSQKLQFPSSSHQQQQQVKATPPGPNDKVNDETKL